MALQGEARCRRGLARLLAGIALGTIFALSGEAAVADARADTAGDSGPAAPRGAEPCPAPDPPVLSSGTWPPACWRPYGESSPFNRSLGGHPKIHNQSSRIVHGTLSSKSVQAFVVGHPHRSPNDFGHPAYYSDLLDPIYTVRCVRWVHRCEVHGKQVHIPKEALPAGGSDGHMAVIDAASKWEYDFWEVRTVPLPLLGGTIYVGHGGRTPWGTREADGLGSNATAAHFGLSAGVIRAEEWEGAAARNGPIRHALFAGVSCTNGSSVYPAAPGTRGSVCEHARASAPPLGTRYQLKMSDAQINALNVPTWKSAILKTLAHYGMIVGDTFGGNHHAFGIVAESDTQYTALGKPGRFAALGQAWGVPTYEGAYVFDIASGVGWRDRLRVVKPCVSRGTC
jgi:hypothetical protein